MKPPMIPGITLVPGQIAEAGEEAAKRFIEFR